LFGYFFSKFIIHHSYSTRGFDSMCVVFGVENIILLTRQKYTITR